MRNLILSLAIVCVSYGLSSAVHAYSRADIFALGSDLKEKLYSVERTVTGEKRAYVFKDPQGKNVVEEKLELDKQGKLLKYEIKHLQEDSVARVSVSGATAEFFFQESGKEGTTKSESFSEDFLVRPMVVPHLQQHWTQLNNSETLRVRYAVPQRQESIRFRFNVDVKSPLEVKESERVVRMRPSNMLLTAVVKPLFIKLSSDGQRLIQMRGRVLPKFRRNDTAPWQDLDADVVFHP